MLRLPISQRFIRRKIRSIQKNAFKKGLDPSEMKQFYLYTFTAVNKGTNRSIIVGIVALSVFLVISSSWLYFSVAERCLLPSNYLVWEASRPLADCAYCENITKPVVLRNVTRRSFAAYTYSSKPIIVKNAVSHWRATKEFSFDLFKRLYQQTDGSYESLEDGCQFLNFKSDLFTLKEVFDMPAARARNEPGQEPWYVGWGNCHPEILAKVRQYYDVPEFLPVDAEFPATENIFFGYEIGAVMHLDYIPRLMWQGQVKGNKLWTIAPVPECDHVCSRISYYVEPGDVVFLDTRIWYHATSIPKGQFSLTVQSEYG
ncbi:uncharacterized protein LOC114365848 [Ostrinia furnacalis]|uniref:uncharacterized protein LOC114365848 n=1 Tax=Ostrinia furnacalis TaxID=93504 RepID=UPI00103CD0EE|nr:uncharacterized protein LOC114365848 [Ostrinia furnacalis]